MISAYASCDIGATSQSSSTGHRIQALPATGDGEAYAVPTASEVAEASRLSPPPGRNDHAMLPMPIRMARIAASDTHDCTAPKWNRPHSRDEDAATIPMTRDRPRTRTGCSGGVWSAAGRGSARARTACQMASSCTADASSCASSGVARTCRAASSSGSTLSDRPGLSAPVAFVGADAELARGSVSVRLATSLSSAAFRTSAGSGSKRGGDGRSWFMAAFLRGWLATHRGGPEQVRGARQAGGATWRRRGTGQI